MAFSYLRIEPDVVVFRRWPRRVRRIPRSDVVRFDALKTDEDGFRGLVLNIPVRSHYLALLMKDGRSVRVPSRDQASVAALRLNNELLR